MSFYIKNFKTLFSVKSNIQALRNKLLQLAIQGKLVEQDPNDEPASELLKKVKDEKNKMIEERKIKKQKPLDPIKEDEIPFKIPSNWEWVRLDDISEYIQRGKSPKYSIVQKYPVIAQKCVQWSGVSLEKALFIEPDSIEKYETDRFLIHGDILWNSTGTGTCGRVGIFTDSIRNEFEKVVADSHVTVVRCFKRYINFNYLFLWLKSPEVQFVIESKASGSTNQIELATSTIKNYLISLPPLAEQDRIVNKVESMMIKIDKLEEKLKKKEHLMELLPKAIVNAIIKCQTVEELNEQLQFVIMNFREIFQTPDSLQQLRNVVLQLAIEGKLVPQEDTDERASELVKRIKAEKEKLDKQARSKKQKSLPKIEEDEIPFQIPDSWEWLRLGNLISITSGDALVKKNMVEDGKCPVYGGNGITGYHNKYNVEQETIVIGRVGFYCGSVHLTPPNSWVTDNAFITTYPTESIDRSWLIQTLRTMDLARNDNATAQPVISQTKIYPLLIPVPPKDEQKRIVKKVKLLMNLIDQLESELKRKVDLVEKMASV